MTAPSGLLRAVIAVATLVVGPTHGAAQDGSGAPITAIDWLSQAPEFPLPHTPVPDTDPGWMMPGSDPTLTAEIVTEPLEGVAYDTTGLFTAQSIGLPRDLWGAIPRSDVIAGIAALPGDTMPTANRLTLRLLQAEFAPPRDDMQHDRDALLRARVDRLVALGALDQAAGLIGAAPASSPALEARAFDIALLLGDEDRACASMQAQAAALSDPAAHIFCRAREGDWQAAHHGLRVAQALGVIEGAKLHLLIRFLEEEEPEPDDAPPAQVTPLIWRMMEALGDPVTTAGLPVRYAHADLRGTSGWRAQIDAAERLTRAGVMQPNRLHGLYTERRAAASGGVWDRVRAVQSLERVLERGDSAAVSDALSRAWPLFAAVELEAAFASMLVDTLADQPVSGAGAEVLWKMLLLADDPPDRVARLAPDSAVALLVMALHEGGELPDISAPPIARAIIAGFEAPELPREVQDQLEDGGGLVLLDALNLLAQASAGDLNAASGGLKRLRALGLEPVARQVAIELLLLDRRG